MDVAAQQQKQKPSPPQFISNVTSTTMTSYIVPRARLLTKFHNIRNVVPQQQQQQLQPFKSLEQRTRTLNFRLYSHQSANSRPIIENVTKDAHVTNKVLNAQGLLTSNILTKQQDSQQGNRKRSRHVLLRWTGLLLRLAPIGFCLFGIYEWQMHKRRCKREQLPRTASEFQSNIYCSMPLRIISRCWGWLAACNVPIVMRPYIYGFYSNTFKVNLEEALYPEFEHYSSLAEFFTRPLKEGARVIDANAPLVSPADGKVLHFGSATDHLIEQVKGVNYNIQDFLGAPVDNQQESDTDYVNTIKKHADGTTALFQCVIYLAPGDYHRFHSATEWQPLIRRHFSGELLSVSPKVAHWLPGLFCLNERVLYMGTWEYGFFSYTAVGATNVGSVEIYTDENLKTNRWVGLKMGTHKKLSDCDELILNTKAKLGKGDLFGQFNMGSTIVLIFEAPKNFKFDIVAGQKIQVGESLGHIVGKKHR